MTLKLTIALSAACLFFSVAGAEAVTLSGGNETPAVSPKPSRLAVSAESGAPLITLLAVAASAARG